MPRSAAVLLPLHRGVYHINHGALGPTLVMLVEKILIGGVLGLTARLTAIDGDRRPSRAWLVVLGVALGISLIAQGAAQLLLGEEVVEPGDLHATAGTMAVPGAPRA